jgi:predicted AAA+ superfamily ATPase
VNLGDPFIIDEVQRAPEFLSTIQVLTDQEGGNGQFVLTGSHQLKLGEAMAQSLAGRTAILTLLSLSIQKLDAAAPTPRKGRDQLLFQGFLPRVHAEEQEPNRAYRSYFQTYVERHRG